MADPIVDGVRQQFQEQIDFLRRKIQVPTETWRDVQRSAHDRAFMVAGALKADLQRDLFRAVQKAVEGGGLQAFRKDFQAAVAKQGWTGWTGEGTKAGEAWRTRVIYQTNVATSYAAGRRKQLLDPELLARRPYWRYVHSDRAAHPRPHHKAWGSSRLTLRHDHPFWDTHFPPNGWGCGCRVVSVRAPGPGDATEPPDGWNVVDPDTDAPVGIDEGWDYAPGANASTDLREFIQDKLVTYPPAISRLLTAEVNQYINAVDTVPDFVRQVLTDRQRKENLWLGFVPRPELLNEVAGTDLRGYTVLLPADTARHVDLHHRFDGGDQRPAQPEDFVRVIEMLDGQGASEQGAPGDNGQRRIVVKREFDGEEFRGVFEVRPGKKNRALTLISLVIKTR